MSALSIAQDPPRRPPYRTVLGRFRAETPAERRARVGEYHWGMGLIWERIAQVIVDEPSPFLTYSKVYP